MPGKTIVVLGAGPGGIVTANRLRRLLQRQHQVVLVDRQREFIFQPSLLWVMVGQRSPERIQRPLRDLLAPGVQLHHAEVKAILPDQRRVVTTVQELAYDYLVVALGAEIQPQALPGFHGTFNFYDLGGAERAWAALQGFSGGSIVILVSRLPYKCPAAPYEAALLVDSYLRRRGLRQRSQVAVYTPEPLPLPVAGPAVGQMVKALLGQRNIEFHPNVTSRAVVPDARLLVVNNGSPVKFDLALVVPPHAGPEPVRHSGLGNDAGWIPVAPSTLQTQTPGIYAIGDVVLVKLPSGKALPKAGVFAHAQGEIVAHSIAAQIQGGSQETFDGYGFCFLELGDGRASFATGTFYNEPEPLVEMRKAGRLWHWGKVLLERYWMTPGLSRALAGTALRLGSTMLGIRARW
jgi:sulfide:quinone oxidoreductase